MEVTASVEHSGAAHSARLGQAQAAASAKKTTATLHPSTAYKVPSRQTGVFSQHDRGLAILAYHTWAPHSGQLNKAMGADVVLFPRKKKSHAKAGLRHG
jgi:hypothetical protein